jgi:hypothetical protein
MDYFAQVPDWEFHPGDYVRRLRRVADLSQRELAEVTGVSHGDLRDGGDRRYPAHLDVILRSAVRRLVGRPVRPAVAAGDL